MIQRNLRPRDALVHLATADAHPIDLAREFQQVLQGEGGAIEQKLFYVDPISADEFRCLLDGESTDTQVLSQMPIRQTADIVLRQGWQELSVIGLGCGDGRYENAIVKEVSLRMGEGRALDYYLFDINWPLLSVAQRNARRMLPGIPVLGVEGDFYKLNRHPGLFGPRRKLILFLGGTFGNLDDELAFCLDSLRGFRAGDMLLVHVSAACGVTDEEIRARDPRLNGELPRACLERDERWFSGTLTRYGLEGRELAFHYELNRLGCPVPRSYSIDALARLEDGRCFTVFRFKRHELCALVRSMKEIGWGPIDGSSWQAGGLTCYLYLFAREAGGIA